MKKSILIILCLVFVLSFCACNTLDQKIENANKLQESIEEELNAVEDRLEEFDSHADKIKELEGEDSSAVLTNDSFEELSNLIKSNGTPQYNESDINNADEVQYYSWEPAISDTGYFEKYKTAFYDGLFNDLLYYPQENKISFVRSWFFDGVPQIYDFGILDIYPNKTCDYGYLEVYEYNASSKPYRPEFLENPGNFYMTARITNIEMDTYKGYGDDLPTEITDYYESDGAKEYFKGLYSDAGVEGNYLSFIRENIYAECRNTISDFVEILKQQNIDYETLGFSSGSMMI